MENIGDLKLQVGELAELKTFEEGYRGAWFRCKIRDINPEREEIQLEYYDFEDLEISWEKIWQVAPYGRKSKQRKKQLILRPRYPLLMCYENRNEMPAVNLISEVCVVIDGKWKVGDMVDWYYDSIYWSARVTKILSQDKVQIELPMPPSGEGVGDNLAHEAFCKDLRPFLKWSQTDSWTLPEQGSCNAQLIFPSTQGMDLEDGGGGGVNILEVQNEDVKMDDDEFVESSESLQVETNDCKTELNIMHEDTVEAAMIDLEELVNKIKWIKNILHNQSPTNTNTNANQSGSWKFV